MGSFGLYLSSPSSAAPARPTAVPELSSAAHHKALNKMLLVAAENSLEELVAVVEEHLDTFNEVNVSTALNRLSRCWAKQQQQDSPECRLHSAQLHRRLSKAVHNLEGCLTKDIERYRPWALSSSVQALAKLGMGGPEVCRAVERRVVSVGLNGFVPQQLSRIVWACAKIGHGSATLFEAVAAEAAGCIHDFNPHDLTSTAWAFSTLEHRSPALFDAIAKVVAARSRELAPQALTNMVWSFARNDHAAPEMFDAVAAAAVACIDDFTTQGLANIAWSFANAGHSSPLLFDTIACASVGRIHQFSSQALANIMWAFATANHSAPRLLNAVAQQVEGSASRHSPHSLCNIVWAFAKLGHPSPPLFQVVAQHAVSGVSLYRPQGLVTTVWSFATLKHHSPALLDAVADMAVASMDRMGPLELTNLAWAYATLEHPSQKLFDSVGNAAACSIKCFTNQGLANTAWAFSSLRHCHPPLFSAICHEVVVSRRSQDLSALQLSCLLLAFARLAELAPGLVDATMARVDQIDPAEVGLQARANILYALALLNRLDGPTLWRLASPLAERRAELTEEARVQLFQCCLAVAQRDGEAAAVAAVAVELLGPELYKEARKSWASMVDITVESQLHSQVFSAICRSLKPSPTACWSEHLTADTMFSVDVMLELEDGRRVAVEVDGPSHFSSNRPFKALGHTLFRRQLLEGEGRAAAVVAVPFYEWYELKGAADEEDRYLQAKLRGFLPAIIDGTAPGGTTNSECTKL